MKFTESEIKQLVALYKMKGECYHLELHFCENYFFKDKFCNSNLIFNYIKTKIESNPEIFMEHLL